MWRGITTVLKVCSSVFHIKLWDGKITIKATTRPIFGSTSSLNEDGCMPPPVVVTNLMSIHKMIYNHIYVHDTLCIHNANALEFPLCHLIRWLQCYICSHNLHYLIWIFHEKYMISHPIFHLLHCINIYHLFWSKAVINCITFDISRPIYALLNERSSKYSFLPKLHQTLCNTEATIHNNHLCAVPNRPC